MGRSEEHHRDTDTESELRRAVRRADAGTFLVEPRVTRRVVRELHNFARLSARVPHTDVCVIRSAEVRRLTHPDELGLESFDSLPDPIVLIAFPEEDDTEELSVQDQLGLVWRRLFHGAIDRALQALVDEGRLTRARIQAHIDHVGQVPFDEAHAVLAAEGRLVDPESRMEAFLEFAAVWWEFIRFAPDLISTWFPSLADRDPSGVIPQIDVDPDLLYKATRLSGAPEPDITPQQVLDEGRLSDVRRRWQTSGTVKPSERRYERFLRRHDRAFERGNSVAAGLAAIQAAEAAPTPAQREQALHTAEQAIRGLLRRLQSALQFDDAETDAWQSSLTELFHNSTHGFWNADKKLLHDLQKVCLDHERVTYRVDLVKWIVSRGRLPLRRPLKNLREVMMAKHLASSASRLVSVRLSGSEREQLAELLTEAAELAEQQMRQRMRPALRETLQTVGLRPKNVPEDVAFHKLIEESLDCIALRGYLTMGYLRDAISRNDLKLSDLTDPAELFRGDHLLRTDDRLDIAMDGVYRRGEFYLRGLQRVSSLAFGTRSGRFATLFLAIPFGGALIIVEGISHLIELFVPHRSGGHAANAPEQPETQPAGSVPGSESFDPAPAGPGQAFSDSPDAVGIDSPFSAPVFTAVGGPPATAASSASAEPRSLKEIVGEPVSDVVGRDHLLAPAERYSLILLIGLLVMALVHLPTVRAAVTASLQVLWQVISFLLWRLPRSVLRFPPVRWVLNSRVVSLLRHWIVTPVLLTWAGGIAIPNLWGLQPLSVPWAVVISVLLSGVLNSRLGRDTEELAAEWIGHALHRLQARVVMAAIDWIADFFRWTLSLIERFIYAVDEWLRFHSEESWLSIIVKAVVGVVWSFVVFLIRIYVNLLIEPQINPIKHFPVVTVAHKIILPLTPLVVRSGRGLLEPFIGQVLADSIVATTWFLFPGVFGFLVWELKENWRLYASNRVPVLQPVIVGSHGETVPRLLRPGFHSGTLPKAYARLRRLERQTASFRRFSQRRAWHGVLHHAERDLHRFVERELVQLLRRCPAWADSGLHCSRIQVACNTIRLELTAEDAPDAPIRILLQEQSHWIVAAVEDQGFLPEAGSGRLHSFDTALQGFYRKAGVELVQEQLRRSLVGSHPFDVGRDGLTIWPEGQYDREITVDLSRPHQLRPAPTPLAITFGIGVVSAESAVFARSRTRWDDWVQLWHVDPSDPDSRRLPLACVQSARLSVLQHRSG